MRAVLPPGSLAGLRGAVFGLGDSGYAEFNVVAKKMGARLAQLGWAPLAPLCLSDAAARGGVDAALDAWLPSLWSGLRSAGLEPVWSGEGVRPADSDVDGSIGVPRFHVEVVDAASPPPPHACIPPLTDILAAHAAFAVLDAAAAGGDSPPGTAREGTARGRGAGAPAAATVAANDRMTAETHFQDVRTIVLRVTPPLPHAPGDVAAVLPAQSTASVSLLCARVGVSPTATLRVTSPSAPHAPPVVASAAALVAGVLELDGAPPRRRLFGVLAAATPPGPAADRLAAFASPSGRDELDLYCTSESRSLAAVLADFPQAEPSLPWLLTAAPRLRPRRFSIASWTPDGTTLDLAVAVVDYQSPHGRRVRGLVSSWMGGWVPNTEVPLWVEAGSLPPPPQDAPLVLVGPGTGVAPMRAILQQRAVVCAQRAAAAAPLPPPCRLFFGCRSRAADCHFEADWEKALKAGVLASLHVAASRDAESKFYVSHALKQAASAVWTALDTHRGTIYVAGAAGAMPAGVRRALEGVAETAGGLDTAGAKAWVRRLVAERRLCEETWA